MAIHYSLDAKLNILGEFLEEYTQWHTAVVKSLLLKGPKPDAPEKMISWLNDLLCRQIRIVETKAPGPCGHVHSG